MISIHRDMCKIRIYRKTDEKKKKKKKKKKEREREREREIDG